MGVLDDRGPRRFQDTMGDFGAETGGRGGSLQAWFFDVLHVDGLVLLDEPLADRRAALAEVVPAAARLPSIETDDVEEAARFLEVAVATGHEGVMVKRLDQPYEAGRRGGAWRKVKPVHTFDLVVIAVEWGHGRRTGTLSNLHLAARAGGADGELLMVGKTFKGMTDAMLAWQTERFLGLELGRSGHVVHVRPEQVVEVAIDRVQRSTRYPGGVALRFARVRRYRDDKSPADADTIDALRALL
jgi:DNA ligase-1